MDGGPRVKVCPFEPFITSKDDSDEAEPSSSKTPTKGMFWMETLFNRGIICLLFINHLPLLLLLLEASNSTSSPFGRFVRKFDSTEEGAETKDNGFFNMCDSLLNSTGGRIYSLAYKSRPRFAWDTLQSVLLSSKSEIVWKYVVCRRWVGGPRPLSFVVLEWNEIQCKVSLFMLSSCVVGGRFPHNTHFTISAVQSAYQNSCGLWTIMVGLADGSGCYFKGISLIHNQTLPMIIVTP